MEGPRTFDAAPPKLVIAAAVSVPSRTGLKTALHHLLVEEREFFVLAGEPRTSPINISRDGDARTHQSLEIARLRCASDTPFKVGARTTASFRGIVARHVNKPCRGRRFKSSWSGAASVPAASEKARSVRNRSGKCDSI